MKTFILTFLLLLSTVSLSAQWRSTKLSEEEKRAEYIEKIGLDLSVADFETKKNDSSIMGKRLAGILDFPMENYHQGVYDRRLGQIASEQNEALENVYFQLKKMKFVNAVKKGNEIPS